MFKPLDPDILQCKVNVFLELHGQKEALKKTNTELQVANEKILEQQESLIEEERVKVLLQMAGAKAHELNQPLAFRLCHNSKNVQFVILNLFQDLMFTTT